MPADFEDLPQESLQGLAVIQPIEICPYLVTEPAGSPGGRSSKRRHFHGLGEGILHENHWLDSIGDRRFLRSSVGKASMAAHDLQPIQLGEGREGGIERMLDRELQWPIAIGLIGGDAQQGKVHRPQHDQ